MNIETVNYNLSSIK